LTGGLSWSAEHTLVRTGEATGTWAAIVTVENSTGRDFHDATLKLVAGEPRRERVMPPPQPVETAFRTLAVAEANADLAEQSFALSPLYPRARPAPLRDRESQSLSMIPPRPVKLTPRYLYRGGGPSVTAQLLLENSNAAGLGLPLPGGRVRIYESDPGG